MKGNKAKKRRLKLGWTQRQVAKKIGISRSAVANFENGYRGIGKHYQAALEKALR
jgi:transcriptional regulator with XRE-family HTH domain